MATVAELKTQADDLGITYASKVRKATLETMIAGALAARERVAASRIAPMSNSRREATYLRQNGCQGVKFTPAQARRIRKAGNRAKGMVTA